MWVCPLLKGSTAAEGERMRDQVLNDRWAPVDVSGGGKSCAFLAWCKFSAPVTCVNVPQSCTDFENSSTATVISNSKTTTTRCVMHMADRQHANSLTHFRRSSSSATMRCRASAVRGAAPRVWVAGVGWGGVGCGALD
jgi:hypothetical protein